VADSTVALLQTIGSGRMPPVVYDTAWVARLADLAPDLGNAAMNWLCAHQLSDGSWGAEAPYYYHDRVICTLAAMLALANRGRRSQDRAQLERGQRALERICDGATQGLAGDARGATVGFEMIAPTLVAEAEQLGLISNQGKRILGRLGNLRQLKRTKLHGRINRYSTVAFSAEMAGPDLEMLDLPNLVEENGSVGCSPAATSYYLLRVVNDAPAALAYLRNCIAADGGGIPNVSPFDTFEVGWVLWNLALTRPEIKNHPAVSNHLAFLQKAWKAAEGIGFAAGYSVRDGDDTGLVYDTLARYGVAPDVEAVLSYREPDHFRCFPQEANPSNSAHAHILGALRAAGLQHDDLAVQIALRYLERGRTRDGYWYDKWHLSPYYVTSHVIIACAGYAPELVLQAVKWMIATQGADGAWGAYLPTAEETAYCIQALWVWTQHQANQPSATAAVRRALPWLQDHAAPPYPPLWIGKCLYCPEHVIRSAVQSALSVR